MQFRRRFVAAALDCLALPAFAQPLHGASWTVVSGRDGDETANQFDFVNPRYGLAFSGVPAGALRSTGTTYYSSCGNTPSDLPIINQLPSNTNQTHLSTKTSIL